MQCVKASSENSLMAARKRKTPMSAAERMRKYRKRKKENEIQGNQNVQQQIQTRPSKYRTAYEKATLKLKQTFFDNSFGHVCSICDRLWFLSDLKAVRASFRPILIREFPDEISEIANFKVCSTCFSVLLRKNFIPPLSRSNGYKYPDHPPNLPALDLISERLISPRLPFMQIRRLRKDTGTFKIIGQIINIPINVNNMVQQLPRQLDDDYAFNISIKKNIIHKSSYLYGQVKKSVIKKWLTFMVTTPLYKYYNINFNENNMSIMDNNQQCEADLPLENLNANEVTNDAEMLLAQQHTMFWDESKYLDIAPGQHNQPLSLIYDTYAEELSFPNIYYGTPRIIKAGVKSSVFSLATSELKRRDRRGATPHHILYIAVKIMRFRVIQQIKCNFKMAGNTSNITRRMIEDKTYLEFCVENNLAFLSSIPNSVQYWSSRKKDLFSMIRQLGKPTFFLTLSANEVRWPYLLNLLLKFNLNGNNAEISDPMRDLSALQRATLVNNDPVICCIYFNRLVDCIMRILSSKSNNPFEQYRVLDYFKRIEFQHRGSPHAHILLWLDNVPNEAVSENMPKTTKMINELCSVSSTDLPDFYSNQVHKHTFTCFKKNNKNCRFNIPFWPIDRTRILLPLTKDDGRYKTLKQKSMEVHLLLSQMHFETFHDFLQKNNFSLEYYLNIIRASLQRPTVIFKRDMPHLWTNTFNPWIGCILNSNMDLQYILDEYSCASYVVEYVNKSSRGVSNLHKQLIELQAEHPDQDFADLMKKVCINMLNTIEMSSQEAAWFLLRQPMSKSSRDIIFIPTIWPQDRHKQFKRKQQMDEEDLSQDSSDVWNLNIIQKYENREQLLEDVCLADFVACYSWSTKYKKFTLRPRFRIIRYINYDMTQNLSEYKREMVTLFFPFRNEHIQILDHMKFIQIFDDNKVSIMQMYEKYAKIDINKCIADYNSINEMLQQERDAVNAAQENRISRQATTMVNNDDINNINTNITSAIVRTRSNVMSAEAFGSSMRQTNKKQKDFLLTYIDALSNGKTFQVFFTGAAGTGKTFTLNLLREITNRFCQNHNTQTNAYVACASTGKAAIAIGGTTVHAAFRIAVSKQSQIEMSRECLQAFRNAFANIQLIIIDEVSMVSAGILQKIDARLREISGNFDTVFGGFNVVFCGDLRQLPPVNARAIYKPPRDSICGAMLWQSLKFYQLTQVMRQSDLIFSNILTKIGNGNSLATEEITLLETRFRSIEFCKEQFPNTIRLFHRNEDVDKYNMEIMTQNGAYVTSLCTETFTGYKSNAELVSSKNKLYKMSVTLCGGLPYTLNIVIGKPYIINTNIDVTDGLVNGAIGYVKYIENDEEDENEMKRIWLDFENEAIGQALRIASRPLVASKSGILQYNWTPITKRHATISLTRIIKCKRIQFPISPASALTIHKSQGGTFNDVVFSYNKSLDQQLVYVALSRVTSIEGLYLTNPDNILKFFHCKENINPTMVELRNEFERLDSYKMETVCDHANKFFSNSSFSMTSFNVQSLGAHIQDFESDEIISSTNLLLLSESWVENNHLISINKFQTIAQFKSSHRRAGGVCILKNINCTCVCTPQTFITQPLFQTSSDIGDICAAKVEINNKSILLISVYITCNTSLNDIELFLASHLTAYSTNIHLINPLLASYGYHKIPMIITGDFNTDLKKTENLKLLHSLKEQFDLDLVNQISSTTMGNTCLDIVLARYISNINCYTYVSYCSYHKPILISIK